LRDNPIHRTKGKVFPFGVESSWQSDQRAVNGKNVPFVQERKSSHVPGRLATNLGLFRAFLLNVNC
jgi:hypothetical protein